MATRRFSHRDRQRLERAADLYLRQCYRSREAARATEFASFLGVTSPYLGRVVPEIVGMPVREFLRRRQLSYAADLLHATPAPIEDIARGSAFGTASTFHRCFVAAYGVTPAAYRREVTKRDKLVRPMVRSPAAHPERCRSRV
jgi:AraC-like DNA-binding protein